MIRTQRQIKSSRALPGILAALAFLAAVLGFALAAPATVEAATTPTWTFTPLDAPLDRASYARIDHENGVTRVVWFYSDPLTGQSHVYLYDSSQALGSTVVCIDEYASAGTSYNIYPDYNDGVIVWMAKASMGDTYEICAYFLDDRYFGNGKTFVRITDNNVDDSSPRTDHGKVVWAQQDGSDYEIWLWYRLKSPGLGDLATYVRLTNNSANDVHPDIYTYGAGSAEVMTRVVYTTYASGVDGDIQEWYALYDYPTAAGNGNVRVISANDQLEDSPCVGQKGICWTGFDGNDWEIYWFHWKSGDWVTERLTDNAAEDSYPDIDGERVVWQSWPKGQTGMLGSVQQYDIATGQTAQVSDAQHPALTPPTISEGRIAYEFSTNGGTVADVCIATPATAPGGTGFSDIDGSPYADTIMAMANLGIISGYQDGTFRPNSPVLRKHFAKMIVGAMGYTVTEADWSDANPPFTDCGPDDLADVYPHDFIAVAKANGLTQGKTATTFAPDANITRAQLVTMVVRATAAASFTILGPLNGEFTGQFRNYNDPNHGFNVKMAEYAGLLDGLVVTGDPLAWIKGNATRGEVAQILVNLIRIMA